MLQNIHGSTLTGSTHLAGLLLDDLEEPVTPPVAEIDVVAPNVPLIVATVVILVIINTAAS
ncbi:hypothetical protein [Sorangium sp. So ce861]|uniref:hypothetical protein n=1 Tax=Sorangium sp. So ce861 TaxID=3133323 RepID=UPI003F628A15